MELEKQVGVEKIRTEMKEKKETLTENGDRVRHPLHLASVGQPTCTLASWDIERVVADIVGGVEDCPWTTRLGDPGGPVALVEEPTVPVVWRKSYRAGRG